VVFTSQSFDHPALGVGARLGGGACLVAPRRGTMPYGSIIPVHTGSTFQQPPPPPHPVHAPSLAPLPVQGVPTPAPPPRLRRQQPQTPPADRDHRRHPARRDWALRSLPALFAH
jgi:hypothetical protein